jgi:hypothetical protein
MSRTRRLWAAAESIAIGFGSDAIGSSATALPPRRSGDEFCRISLESQGPLMMW